MAVQGQLWLLQEEVMQPSAWCSPSSCFHPTPLCLSPLCVEEAGCAGELEGGTGLMGVSCHHHGNRPALTIGA